MSGALSGHGGALLANDMHLSHSLPNIWYRARMSWPEGAAPRAVVGVTLPGLPALVSGSNGQVAWGFTNSYGDWVDLVILETDPDDPSRYRAPDRWHSFTRRAEIITVARAKPDTLWLDETIWGPVWATDSKGRSLALRWTAHDSSAVNLNLFGVETAAGVDELVAIAGRIGMPQQNVLCADTEGRIAWTIAGAIPRRVGWDGRLPASWADGTCRWDGYLAAADQPRIVDPAEGRLWSANNRVTAGADLALIGDGGYGTGARARQIRDHLRALDRPLEADMLAVQLDDRAIFMGEWRELILAVLERVPPPPDSPRADFLRVVAHEWSGRAEAESVAYRLVDVASYRCVRFVYQDFVAALYGADPEFRPSSLPYRYAVAWEVLTSRPDHLLPPYYADWDGLILAAVDEAMSFATRDGAELEDYQWGADHVVTVAHPFARVMPWLSRWLAAPAQSLPGDAMMPRVQFRQFGASERLVVSPGKEERGIFHMPGGQSGHPLSPYFLAGHEAWASGRAMPLLPGPAVHELRLVPQIDKH